MNEVQRILAQQLNAQGIFHGSGGYRMVLWAGDAVKVNLGTRGVIILYNRAMDLYDVQRYEGMNLGDVESGIFWDSLWDVVRSACRTEVTA